MYKHGITSSGNQRFFCPICKKTSLQKRKDTKQRNLFNGFKSWIVGKLSLSEIAKEKHCSIKTLERHFSIFFQKEYKKTFPKNKRIYSLIIDAKYFNNGNICVFIALINKKEVYFDFYDIENYENWNKFLSQFPRPIVVVADGQKGIKKAVFERFPDVSFQRCHFHFIQLVSRYITRFPDHNISKDIWKIVCSVDNVKNLYQKNIWITKYRAWKNYYKSLLCSDKKHWISRRLERKLNSVIIVIERALPYLFTYIDYGNIPNTTNHIEGGINAEIARLLGLHRGLPATRQKTLISIFLKYFYEKKPK